jgi:hypothetical protein
MVLMRDTILTNVIKKDPYKSVVSVSSVFHFLAISSYAKVIPVFGKSYIMPEGEIAFYFFSEVKKLGL